MIVVTAYIKEAGYEAYTAIDGLSGLKAPRSFKPDLIVLDIMLPGMDGIELLTQLRRESSVYVIMLTARAEETDKIIGLSVGADDYPTKHFSPRELFARIKASLRRLRTASGSSDDTQMSFPHIRIDSGRRQDWLEGTLIALTATEFDLLKTLAEYSWSGVKP